MTLPRVNITKVYPALLRFLDVFYWQSQTLDRETLAWTRHGLAGYVATTSLLREMGLDVSTETHQVLRHESCLINQPGPQDAPVVSDSGRTRQPLCQPDNVLLCDCAQTRKQCKDKRVLSKSCIGPGKFAFPQGLQGQAQVVFLSVKQSGLCLFRSAV